MDRRRLNSLLDEWAASVLRESERSGISAINIVEKLLRDPGFSTSGGGHRVLWWPRNRRMSLMAKIMHQIDKTSQLCLIIDTRRMMNSDTGQPITMSDLARNRLMSAREFKERVKQAKSKTYRLLCMNEKKENVRNRLKRKKKKSTGQIYRDMR